MSEETKKLLILLTSGRITKEEFIREYSNDKRVDKEYCFDLLKQAVNDKDDEKVEEAIVVGSALNCFSNGFSEVFCELLLSDWHYKHEDIARILQDLKDPSTVDCLYDASQLRFEYLDYDDTYQFARRCIKVLSAIDNEEAINKLQLLTNSNIPEIKQYAIKELEYKELL